MAWDFETDAEFQKQLDWMDTFVREEIEPLDFILGHPNDFSDPKRAKLIPPLQAEVKRQGKKVEDSETDSTGLKVETVSAKQKAK